jgi:hypothetical protein
MNRKKPIIALDADGVLLDYHAAYRHAWRRAFGYLPAIRDPQAYWPIDRWEVARLQGTDLDRFRACFDEEFWATVPPAAGAVNACMRLHEAGYDLACVTAVGTLDDLLQAARIHNIRDCGFPITRFMMTGNATTDVSPKAIALRALRPVAFVDDYLPYFRGIPANIHAALITREPNGSPNVGADLELTHSRHANLDQFAAWWCTQHAAQCAERRMKEIQLSIGPLIAGKSDDDIFRMVASVVEGRYREFANADDHAKSLMRLSDMEIYGEPDDPPIKQFGRGIKYYMLLRAQLKQS